MEFHRNRHDGIDSIDLAVPINVDRKT